MPSTAHVIVHLLLVICVDADTEAAPDASCLLQTRGPSPQNDFHSLPHSRLDAQASRKNMHFHLVPHHKGGTMMCRQAADEMTNAGFNATCNMTLGHSLHLSAIPKTSCVAQIARNPFEMVVSGYLYHMSDAERWLEQSFGQAARLHTYDCDFLKTVDRIFAEMCKIYGQNDAVLGFHLRSLNKVLHSTVSGPLSDWLPDAQFTETFPEYLQRVDLDAGLIAEFMWASSGSLEPMHFATDVVESRPCATTVCFDQFYKNCSVAWLQISQAWQIQEPERTAMLHAVNGSCPLSSEHTLGHSSNEEARKRNLTHPPEHELVKRLRELDRVALNGTLARLEMHVGCKIGGKYERMVQS